MTTYLSNLMNIELLNLIFASVGALVTGRIIGKLPGYLLTRFYGTHYKAEYCGQPIHFRTKSKEAAQVLLTVAEEVKLKYVAGESK